MGPNSFRNLTYAAVLAVVGALVYLVYQSSKRKERLNPSVESSASLGSYTDTLGSISGTSSAALDGIDSVNNTVDGNFVSSSSPSSPATYSSGKSSTSEVKEVTAEEPGSLSGSSKIASEDGISSSQKKIVTAKGVKSKTAVKAKEKFDAGLPAGDYMTIAGSFASKDNAEALVAKLKKMGFNHAEAVKMENSANTYTIAGYYKFKGGADAAVRTLKANKIPAIVKKKSGDIYKTTPSPVKPVATPKAPTKSATTAKPI